MCTGAVALLDYMLVEGNMKILREVNVLRDVAAGMKDNYYLRQTLLMGGRILCLRKRKNKIKQNI